MMPRLPLLPGLCFIAGLVAAPAALMAQSADDPRMVVEVLADADKGPELKQLHADVRQAAALALERLWQRLVPKTYSGDLPSGNKAVRFMQRAQPTPEGMRISFDSRRVIAYLEQNHIPYIAEPPRWSLDIRLINAAGQSMGQSARMLREFAQDAAKDLGYVLDTMGESLILQWRWLDAHQVALSVRGTSRLGEMQQTRTLPAGDPLPHLQQWLLEILTRARDAAVVNPEPVTPMPPVVTTDTYADPYANPAFDSHGDPYAQPLIEAEPGVRITIHRRASLPEQVLFEQDLLRDPRVKAVIPTLLGASVRQYRLLLNNNADDGWLPHWLAQHGLSGKPTPDGWLAQ